MKAQEISFPLTSLSNALGAKYRSQHFSGILQSSCRELIQILPFNFSAKPFPHKYTTVPWKSLFWNGKRRKDVDSYWKSICWKCVKEAKFLRKDLLMCHWNIPITTATAWHHRSASCSSIYGETPFLFISCSLELIYRKECVPNFFFPLILLPKTSAEKKSLWWLVVLQLLMISFSSEQRVIKKGREKK